VLGLFGFRLAGLNRRKGVDQKFPQVWTDSEGLSQHPRLPSQALQYEVTGYRSSPRLFANPLALGNACRAVRSRCAEHVSDPLPAATSMCEHADTGLRKRGEGRAGQASLSPQHYAVE
jgi:hypothetical protein